MRIGTFLRATRAYLPVRSGGSYPEDGTTNIVIYARLTLMLESSGTATLKNVGCVGNAMSDKLCGVTLRLLMSCNAESR